MGILLAYIMCVVYPQSPEVTLDPLELELRVFVNQRVYWESNEGPLEEEPVILNAESCLHLHESKKLISTTASLQIKPKQIFYQHWLRSLLNTFVYFHVCELHLSSSWFKQ